MLQQLWTFISGRLPKQVARDYDQILSIVSPYYSALNEERKEQFQKRLYHYLNTMQFSGLHGIIQVSQEMQVLIGSAFIQITLGLPSYIPQRFRTIVVLPRRYAYEGHAEPFLGHIDYPKATLFFSWEDVVEGFAVADDAINVALHEMAHLLEAEEAVSRLADQFFNIVDWREWAQVAVEKLNLMRSGQERFIKSYAATNMKEMFASCVEAFFEQSEDFKAELPHIYYTLCQLLGQDPTQKDDPLVIALP